MRLRLGQRTRFVCMNVRMWARTLTDWLQGWTCAEEACMGSGMPTYFGYLLRPFVCFFPLTSFDVEMFRCPIHIYIYIVDVVPDTSTDLRLPSWNMRKKTNGRNISIFEPVGVPYNIKDTCFKQSYLPKFLCTYIYIYIYLSKETLGPLTTDKEGFWRRELWEHSERRWKRGTGVRRQENYGNEKGGSGVLKNKINLT